MLHQPVVRLQPLSGARKVPLGGLYNGSRWEGRGTGRPRLRTLHGSRLEDDHHRRRVSSYKNHIKIPACIHYEQNTRGLGV